MCFSEPGAGQSPGGSLASPSWVYVAKQKQRIFRENSLEESPSRKDPFEKVSSVSLLTQAAAGPIEIGFSIFLHSMTGPPITLWSGEILPLSSLSKRYKSHCNPIISLVRIRLYVWKDLGNSLFNLLLHNRPWFGTIETSWPQVKMTKIKTVLLMLSSIEKTPDNQLVVSPK